MCDAARVLFINPWEWRIGPNRYLIELLRQDRALARNAVIVLPEGNEAVQEYRAIGCRVETWGAARLVHLQPTLSNVLRLLKRHTWGVLHACWRMRALKAQVVVTNSENVWFGGIAARLLGIPHLQICHALTLEYHWGSRPRLVRGYLRALSLWNTRFIAVSQAVAQMLIRNGVDRQRVSVIPNGLDVEALMTSRELPLPPEIQASVSGRYPVLVSLGRISPMKGHDVLVEALADVKKKYPTLLCLLAGQRGSDEGLEDVATFYHNLQRRISELGLDDSVRFLGEIGYGPALIRAADIYVQPSRTESFCRGVAEALICGKSVIASNVGGIPEVVGNGGALLTPVGDARTLAQAIMSLAADPGLRQQLLAVGRAHVVQNFEARQVVRVLRLLLEELAPSRSTSSRAIGVSQE